MKRFHVIVLCILCLFVSIGCGSRPAEQPPQSTAPAVDAEEIVVFATAEPKDTQQPMPETAAPTDTPLPSDTPANEPKAEPTSAPQRYAVADDVYTIAWISDPQHYSEQFPETYYAMTSFLRDHRDEMNLSYVINTGDFVNHPDADAEWDVADKAQAMIDDIPNGVLAGNHDVLDPVGYKTFCVRFGEKRYQDKPWYGGSFENNRGHYDLLTVGETDYLFVYMGFGPTKKAIEWVRSVFKQYPDRVGILCLHDYYTKKLTLSEDGKKWHDKVVAKSPNLYMVLCGHKYGSYCFQESFDDDKDGREDRTVYQMLFNYQASLHDGGGGYLRLIQVDEARGTMHNLTYSPLTEDYNRFDDPVNREEYYPFDEKNEEFDLPLPWKIEH